MAEAQSGPSRRGSRIVWHQGCRYRIKASVPELDVCSSKFYTSLPHTEHHFFHAITFAAFGCRTRSVVLTRGCLATVLANGANRTPCCTGLCLCLTLTFDLDLNVDLYLEVDLEVVFSTLRQVPDKDCS
ncbi:GH14208 [Drosophila grimshawi]|uniref:GH14208 n=1 Tax=Drosophila grimshawi TaxID=7222 RepID=B4JY08_DROGR|nr:GH14208 [Drosophila grimshawi]